MTVINDLPSMKGTFLKPASILSNDWAALKNKKDITLVLKEGPSSAAMAFKVWPQAKANITKIIYAGGTFDRGNATAYAERSVYADPYGMESLLNSGIPVIFASLEAAAKYNTTCAELADDIANDPDKYEMIYCGVHCEIQAASKAFGKLVPDHLADHKFEKNNAYILN